MAPVLQAAIPSAIHSGQTILTATQRAARTLRQAFDATQKAAGRALWNPPPVFALDTWLSTLHHQLIIDGHETRLLLNPSQQHTLWRGIIAADPAVSGLRSPSASSGVDALAEMAAEAWALLHFYNGIHRLADRETGFTVSTDTRAFQRWAHAFDRLCARTAAITPAQLPAALAEALAHGALPIPNPGLLLVDFDKLAPAHASFFESIRQAGYEISHHRTAVPATSASLIATHDDPAELRAAALWAARHLAHNPEASIAIVVPNLADRRPQIDRVFSELLDSKTVIPAKPESQYLPLASAPLHEFSLGQPLAETAPVSAALDLLRWPLEPLPLETISTLILSPFFGSPTPADTLAAAEFDAFELRRATLLRPELTLEATINLVRRARRADRLHPLLARLQSLNREAQTHTPGPDALASDMWASQSHAHWSETFRALLEAAGWTAATHRDSLSFQIHRRFDSALDELATLDFNATPITAAAALQTLTRIARRAIFAPESRQAPIQILGPLEPGATTFDALWFLSADDATWPPASSPHPFIPWQIQRELGIPAADPARAAAIAQTLTSRLAQSAPEIVFSYARHAGEGDRRPSPLLRALNLTPTEAPAEPAPEPLPLELFDDTESLPPLAPGVTPGGARILELQAACSFRAFAEIRLHSTQPDGPGPRTPGLDARDRGIHVHRIMQEFWAKIQTQQALRDLSGPEREAHLDAAIETALARAASTARTLPSATSSSQVANANRWEDAYLDVQRRRLRALLHPWLEFELSRPPFAVRQQEEKRLAQIGPLTLELRADRIDQTQAGPLILDYKTGVAEPQQWEGPRPDQPQLPLYAVTALHEENLGGIAFALLRAGEDLALKGFADSQTVLDAPSRMYFATLQDQLEDWRRILTSLAESFAHDDPITNPKDYPRTCQRCTQRMLCRLDPSSLLTIDEDELEAVDA